jgi:aminomethyltransferase
MRAAASAEGITISGERTEGASCGADNGVLTMPGCAMQMGPGRRGDMDGTDALKHLPLRKLHKELEGSFVPFAGWEMPVRYGPGVMAEHLWCREKAGLFDVSHMGQVMLPLDAAEALETLVPMDVIGLAEGRQRYAFFTNDAGGLLDDLMIARHAEGLHLVVNAACAAADIAHLEHHLPSVHVLSDRALLALQGPMAAHALAGLVPAVADMRFMDVARLAWNGAELWVSRSGYTGEDGFEISLPADAAEAFSRALLADAAVAPIGLGARDTLRLEAGLPLYGQDLGPEITPPEAGLSWAIQKVRRPGGARAGGYPGAEIIAKQMTDGAPRKRTGLLPQGRAPMRAGTEVFATDNGGSPVGVVTSGGFAPSLGAPVALALIDAGIAEDTALWGDVRGRRLPVDTTRPPFVAHRYHR